MLNNIEVPDCAGGSENNDGGLEGESLVKRRGMARENNDVDDYEVKASPKKEANGVGAAINQNTKEIDDDDGCEKQQLVHDEKTSLKRVYENEQFDADKKVLGSHSVKMTPRFVCLVLASTCGFMVAGYQMAVISGLLWLNTDIPDSTYWRQTLVGIASAMAMVITVTCGQLCDKIGRRFMVMLSAVVAVFAASVEASGVYYTLPGRILAGMSIGLSTLSVPIYLAENTAPSMRGPIIMLNMAALTFGQLLSGIAAAAFYYVKSEGWRFLSGIIIIPSSLQLLGFFFLPESSRFLAKKGRLEEARKVMHLLWRDLPEKELESMISDQTEKNELEDSSIQIFLNILRTPPVRRALLVGCSLHIINQMSGINIILFYSGMVVRMAGVYDDRIAVWLSTIPTLINFLGTFIGFYLVERIGRRLLLLTSTAGVIGSLILVGFIFWQIEAQSPQVTFVEPNADFATCWGYRTCSQCISVPSCGFCYQEHPTLGPINGSCLPVSKVIKQGLCNSTSPFGGSSPPFRLKWETDFCPSNLTYLIMAGQVLYLLFFASGLGPLPWTICAEIYPTWARGICNSISTGVLWLFSFLMTGTFLSMVNHLTTYGTFFLMSCFTLIGLIFWYLCLPETKGKSLEDATLLFLDPFCTNSKLKTEKNGRPVPV